MASYRPDVAREAGSCHPRKRTKAPSFRRGQRDEDSYNQKVKRGCIKYNGRSYQNVSMRRALWARKAGDIRMAAARPHASLRQESRTMITRALDALCLSALGSTALGWAVRTVVIVASRTVAPRSEAAGGRPGPMAPAR
ncbi:hypothetical protein JCM16408A_38350 [Methylobacterium phyllosphaerae]